MISLFGFHPSAPPLGFLRLVDGQPHWLSTEAAALVAGLTTEFELAWCSGWEDRADEHLPVAVGAPAGLPHLVFGPPPDQPARHWKLDAIDEFAGPGHPLAWVDDAFDDSCHAWAAARPGPTLLVATEPAVGFTEAHAKRLRAWAGALSADT